MTATEWLGKLWPVILAGVMGIVGVFVGYRLTARRSARVDHLRVLKVHVLRPLRDDLERFYLPLLGETLGPVTIAPRRRNLGGPINEPSLVWEYPIAARRVPEPRFFLTGNKEERPELNAELYKDAKIRHYAKLLDPHQTFREAVTEYCSRWVLYAEHLSQAIAERTGLPMVREQSGAVEPIWIDAKRLAVFTIDWQLGIVLHAPWVSSDGLSLEIGGQTVVRADARETIQKVLDSLDVISRDRGRFEELRQALPGLHREARNLLTEFERLLLSSRLPGRCAFCKA